MELVRASTHEGPARLLCVEQRVRERHHRDEAGARPANDARASQRCRYDDPGAGSSNAPQQEGGGVLEDFYHRLELVL
jgi:hypothetical protein